MTLISRLPVCLAAANLFVECSHWVNVCFWGTESQSVQTDSQGLASWLLPVRLIITLLFLDGLVTNKSAFHHQHVYLF